MAAAERKTIATRIKGIEQRYHEREIWNVNPSIIELINEYSLDAIHAAEVVSEWVYKRLTYRIGAVK